MVQAVLTAQFSVLGFDLVLSSECLDVRGAMCIYKLFVTFFTLTFSELSMVSYNV